MFPSARMMNFIDCHKVSATMERKIALKGTYSMEACAHSGRIKSLIWLGRLLICLHDVWMELGQ